MTRAEKILLWVQFQRGGKRFWTLFLTGALAALAMPPFFVWPVFLVAFPMLYLAVTRAESPRQAFSSGWSWAFGYFVAGLYWIANALLTDPEKFGWLVPFALTLLPAALAVYYGAAALLVALLRQFRFARQEWCSVLCFAASITLMEWLRGWLFTGFPWNVPGYAINASTFSLQLAAWVGLFGATAVVVGLATLPVVALLSRNRWPLLVSALGALLVVVSGAVRLQMYPTVYVDGVLLRLVQPNIPQQYKWKPGARVEAMLLHVEETTGAPLEPISAVVWSETAVPFFVDGNFDYMRKLSQAVPPGGALLTGAMRVEHPERIRPWLYNSLFALGEGGRILATYDKRHLVPFGEYVPFRGYLPLVSLVYGGQDFSRGTGSPVMEVEGLPPFRPLICYEAIFPSEVAEGRDRAQWLLNITNDAWFGFSPGPYQHFEAARMRAVELGLPLVRVANTGISGVVDGYGRVIQRTRLEEQAVMDVPLPAAIPNRGSAN